MLTKSRTVVITGTSRGIGLKLAQQLVKRGDRVIGIGRSPQASVFLDGEGSCEYLQADVCNSQQRDRLVSSLGARIDRLDVLIHNAAIGYYGPFEHQADLDALVISNTIAPILLTRALAPLLMSSDNPRVVFVSSAHSQWPAHQFASYVASKCALEGFSRSLQVEWRGKVDVQVLFPGATATSLHRDAGVPVERIEAFRRVDASAVARRIADAISRPNRWRCLYLRDTMVRLLGRVWLPLSLLPLSLIRKRRQAR